MDPETARHLNAHLEENYKECANCGGERRLLFGAVSMPLAVTPLTNPVSLTGSVEQFFPVICQSCGFTVFFSARAVVKSHEG
jgi:hypothetical protein